MRHPRWTIHKPLVGWYLSLANPPNERSINLKPAVQYSKIHLSFEVNSILSWPAGSKSLERKAGEGVALPKSPNVRIDFSSSFTREEEEHGEASSKPTTDKDRDEILGTHSLSYDNENDNDSANPSSIDLTTPSTPLTSTFPPSEIPPQASTSSSKTSRSGFLLQPHLPISSPHSKHPTSPSTSINPISQPRNWTHYLDVGALFRERGKCFSCIWDGEGGGMEVLRFEEKTS